MKKQTRFIGIISVLALVVVFVFSATAIGKGKDEGKDKGKGGGEDWDIMTYVPDNGYTVPVPLPVEKSGKGVAFDFYATPDRAVLLNSDMDTKKYHEGDLSGKTLSAKISIKATPGATFNYFNNDTGNADPGGFVHLYFQTGSTTPWDPSKPAVEAKYWWSNPVHVDLNDLAALGKKGIKIEVPLDPGSWSDRDGHMGTSAPVIGGTTYDHTILFNKATEQVAKAGLSFGGAGWWAFGCGVNAPGDAVFKLDQFEVKKTKPNNAVP